MRNEFYKNFFIFLLGNRRAPIWKYFIENKCNETVICMLCSRIFPNKKNWGTGNMKRHLKLHPVENAYTRYMMKKKFDNRNLCYNLFNTHEEMTKSNALKKTNVL